MAKGKHKRKQLKSSIFGLGKKVFIETEFNKIHAGHPFLISFWMYKTATQFRRVSVKDLVFRGKQDSSLYCRYVLTITGVCISKGFASIKSRSAYLKARVFCKGIGLVFFFFINCPNVVFLKRLRLQHESPWRTNLRVGVKKRRWRTSKWYLVKRSHDILRNLQKK